MPLGSDPNRPIGRASAAEPSVWEAPPQDQPDALAIPGLVLTSWHGRSGRRYVAGIHPLIPAAFSEAGPEVVVLAVRRDPAGRAAIVARTHGLTTLRAARNWCESAARAGAGELHIHRLAAGEAEARAILIDLTEGAALIGWAA